MKGELLHEIDLFCNEYNDGNVHMDLLYVQDFWRVHVRTVLPKQGKTLYRIKAEYYCFRPGDNGVNRFIYCMKNGFGAIKLIYRKVQT